MRSMVEGAPGARRTRLPCRLPQTPSTASGPPPPMGEDLDWRCSHGPRHHLPRRRSVAMRKAEGFAVGDVVAVTITI